MSKEKIILKSEIPEDALEIIAARLIDDMVEFFNDEENQKEFEAWKNQQSGNKGK